MKKSKITFIGGGHMAASLIGGLIADHVPPAQLCASDPESERLSQLAAQFGIRTTTDNAECIADADVVVLAVKPQILHAVCTSLAATLPPGMLIISVAAGVRSQAIARWLGKQQAAVVRAMPNSPALLQSGATGLYASPAVSEQQRDLAESILRATGLTVWLDDEAQLDTVTALSGSGPAYFFRIMEALEQAAVELGLSERKAHLLTLQTALGAAKMAIESSESVSVLRERVTSPGGTTEQGLHVLEEADIDALMKRVLTAAHERAEELARLLEETP